jgi:hypothetical protein
MNREVKKHRPLVDEPVSSPYPALQAVLPRLGAKGRMDELQPLFLDLEEAEFYLEDSEWGELAFVVPVWAIDHTDLQSSEIVRWTIGPWLH